VILIITISCGLGFMLLERLFPDQKLPHSSRWWGRAIGFNVAQVGMVVLGGVAWDTYLQRVSLFGVNTMGSPMLQGLIGYGISTFIYYWWHRVRHTNNLLWVGLHQVHHSPVRIEVITSFYKHPTELMCNSILSGAIGYTFLGLSIEGSAWMTLFSGLGEFFYHMNIATPRWVGFFIQRPEMHRIHHQRNVHASNYGDLPIWDMMFGTYSNPPTYDGQCGFDPPRESEVLAMLICRDVNARETATKP
jgi:sterol desaturase/sphingolipid hydroxylase (fatty acid hydroxylase superfamily)